MSTRGNPTTEMHGDSQSKFIQKRVDEVEKNFGLLCQTFGSIARKNARLRDKSDILATQVMAQATGEHVNHSTRKCLKEFAGNFATIQDYRQAQIERLEAKVIKPLSNYGNICKTLKGDLKTETAARKREMKQQMTLQKAQQKSPSEQGQIVSQAQNELERASADADITGRNLEESMERFETNKIGDIKKVFGDFLKIEMVFHTKALEYLSKCYQNVSDIDEDEDILTFKNTIREHTRGRRQSERRAGESMDWTGGDVSSPGDTMTTTAREQTTRSSSGMYTDGVPGNDDDDDDDDEDLSDDDQGYHYRR